jgi:PAS domain-containing protein
VREDLGRAGRETGCNVDVTEAKAAELALREGEERLRLALAAGRLGTWEPSRRASSAALASVTSTLQPV